jgi:heptosyltransferase-2
VAAAVGIPLVALYGSSTPDYTPPLTRSADILYLRLECSPCFERTCPLGHYNCLRHISVERVFERIPVPSRHSEPPL